MKNSPSRHQEKNVTPTDAHKGEIRSIRTIFSALLLAITSTFPTPPGLRGSVSKRILEEKEFATLFLEGKFLPLHQQYTTSLSSNVLENLKKEINIGAEVRNAIKAENLSFKTLWRATSLGQKFTNFFMTGCVIAGAGMTIKYMLPEKGALKKGEEEKALNDTIITLGFNQPNNQVTNIVSELLYSRINSAML